MTMVIANKLHEQDKEIWNAPKVSDKIKKQICTELGREVPLNTIEEA